MWKLDPVYVCVCKIPEMRFRNQITHYRQRTSTSRGRINGFIPKGAFCFVFKRQKEQACRKIGALSLLCWLMKTQKVKKSFLYGKQNMTSCLWMRPTSVINWFQYGNSCIILALNDSLISGQNLTITSFSQSTILARFQPCVVMSLPVFW